MKALECQSQISILKNFTRPYRVRRREPVIRFETPPGRQAQVGWAHLGTHALPAPTRLHLFVMVLGFSWALSTEAADLPTFLACQKRAFHFFGGMPREILLR